VIGSYAFCLLADHIQQFHDVTMEPDCLLQASSVNVLNIVKVVSLTLTTCLQQLSARGWAVPVHHAVLAKLGWF
jgi:hypothetical protein